ISSPLIFQDVISLVNGSAAAQEGSSSSLSPCGVVSPFSVTTQVLLRSVVASSHCPIMSFFRVEASCAAAGGASASSAVNAATVMPERPDNISAPSPEFPEPASAAPCRQTSFSDCRPQADPWHCALPPKLSRYVATAR